LRRRDPGLKIEAPVVAEEANDPARGASAAPLAEVSLRIQDFVLGRGSSLRGLGRGCLRKGVAEKERAGDREITGSQEGAGGAY
jgi:hypothetical protein